MSIPVNLESNVSKAKMCFHEKFRTELPSYAPISIVIRFIFVSLIGVLSLQLIVSAFSDISIPHKEGPNLKDYIFVIVAYNLLSELQIVLDNILERFFPIPNKIKIRVILAFCLNIVLIPVVYNIIKTFAPHDHDIPKELYYFAISLGLIFVTILSTTLLMMRFTEKWVKAQENIDEMKREKLKMDYNVLQDQLNPHFLFNNLSVLKSLIIYDTDTAVEFTENFTDVYRYVLQSKNKMLVSLKSEVDFIYAYLGLHKERLGEGLQIDFSINNGSLNKEIAPLTAQLLIENAIKHNITSRENPLHLSIRTDEEYLYVENNLQIKETSYSTQTGLSNLIKRYQILTEQEVIIDESNKERFLVKVPLI